MIEKGFKVTCTGCGESTFIDSPVISLEILKLSGGDSRTLYYKPKQPDSWVKVAGIMDLCPRCQKIREQMLCKFYEECGAERDKANGVSV